LQNLIDNYILNLYLTVHSAGFTAGTPRLCPDERSLESDGKPGAHPENQWPIKCIKIYPTGKSPPPVPIPTQNPKFWGRGRDGTKALLGAVSSILYSNL